MITKEEIKTRIELFEHNYGVLPGIELNDRRESFVCQVYDSCKRVEVVNLLKQRGQGLLSTNPHSGSFNPLKGAIYFDSIGEFEEAVWLVFLLTVTGKNKKTRWELCKNLYGGITNDTIWNWDQVFNNINKYTNWINNNHTIIKRGVSFGNHRKFETLKPGNKSCANTIQTYLELIKVNGNQKAFFTNVLNNTSSPAEAFDKLYHIFDAINRFGRTSRFDFLTMLGKINIIPVEPGKLYLSNSTGPLQGCRILFGQNMKTEVYENKLSNLHTILSQRFGMQILEDAICNWQKSPNRYVKFIG